MMVLEFSMHQNFELGFLSPALMWWLAGWWQRTCKSTRSQGIRCSQGSCHRRHHWRSSQGHFWPFTQHPHQAHGSGVLGVCSVLCNSWGLNLQMALKWSFCVLSLTMVIYVHYGSTKVGVLVVVISSFQM